ncbi:MAG: hypothetical protein ACKOE6_00140, partial [Flammeovirgaceae bacterium]
PIFILLTRFCSDGVTLGPNIILIIMRVVGEIPHPEIKITLFHWNNRYLIKLEAGPFEQTFKVQEFDVASEEDLRQIVNETFLRQAIERFNDMAQSLQQATQFL